MDAAQLAERLASDSAEDRSAAYAVIEATQDVGLAALLAEPLAALLGRPEEEIGASELQRASLALGHLVSLDCVAVGGEFFRDDRWLARWSNEANALGRILSKPTAELTRGDALVVAAVESPFAAALAKGIDVHAPIGFTGLKYLGGWLGCSHGALKGTDERNNRLSTLLGDALREEREQLQEGMVAGAFMLLTLLSFARDPTCQHQLEIGIVELALAELRTLTSSQCLSVRACASGRASVASFAIATVFLAPDIDFRGTSGLPEFYLDVFRAYEQVGPSEDTNTLVLYEAILGMYVSNMYEFSKPIASAIRDSAASFRFMIDYPPPYQFVSELGFTQGMMTSLMATKVFGRDEGDTMQLRQDDIDAVLAVLQQHIEGTFMSGTLPIDPTWSECLLAISVSDHHKALLLENPVAIPHLTLGLFLDPDHPRGLRAKEILHDAANPTPVHVQQYFQRNYTEALEQLALFGPGREALLRDEAAAVALEAVVEHGMTEEAKEHARGALIALRGVVEADEVSAPNHIMLSYVSETECQIVAITH